jgi:hypothetical protein
MRETYPLRWPEGWPRTPLKDREPRAAWKKTEKQAIEALEIEMKRFGVISSVLTRKDPSDIRTAADPSVCVQFSRKHEDDFSWQSALGISKPDPTLEEIDSAFRRLATQHHPDRGGDTETFMALNRHKKAAVAFVNRLSGTSHEYAIACDKYKEMRWNILAIAHTIHSWRQMERDGASSLLERSMQGFAALGEGQNAATSS